MDFAKLDPKDLDEFLQRNYSVFRVKLDPFLPNKVSQAKNLFEQLQNIDGVTFPLPVVDLYLASIYNGPRDKTYTRSQINGLNQDEINVFDRIFNFDASQHSETTNRLRIYRILKYLGLISDPIQTRSILAEERVVPQMEERVIPPAGEQRVIPPRFVSVVEPDHELELLKQIEEFEVIERIKSEPESEELEPELEEDILKFERDLIRGLQKSKPIEPIRSKSPEWYQRSENAFKLSIQRGNLDAVRKLLDMGAPTEFSDGNSALLWASEYNQMKIAQLLLERGVDVNHQNDLGFSALMLAAGKRNFRFMGLLFQHGADPNLQSLTGDTALLIAVNDGNFHITDYLLQKLANPNIQNTSGLVPLSLASRKNLVKIAFLLIQNGSLLNHQDDLGKTALHLAVEQGHLGMAQLLVEQGADISLRTDGGQTALDIAVERKYLDIAQLFISRSP